MTTLPLNKILCGDALTTLRTLPADSVDCCVTSPPYYGLRDYGTAEWQGGSPECSHSEREEKGFEKWKQSTNRGNSKPPKGICPKCGAVRVDNQLGLEDTPEEYISRLADVFDEVRRVLKPAGTLWLNIGDSYWGGKGYSGGSAGEYQYQRRKEKKSINPAASNIGGKGCIRPTDKRHPEIKTKDLVGIPWLLAFELRRRGWYLRQDIIWHKPNPMPESVRDRCTKSHEYIFLLTKSANYYFNHEAIQEPANYDGRKAMTHAGSSKYAEQSTGLAQQTIARGGQERWKKNADGEYMRNKRDVWTVNTKPEKESHFAIFPQRLIMDCIKAGCVPGGVVLDPFSGSGTTAVVAKKLERNYIGIELNPDYVKLAERKLRRELGMWL